jgi:hypothetical protein
LNADVISTDFFLVVSCAYTEYPAKVTDKIK